MRDFSIDIQAEKIHSSKTREYFDDVVKSYHAGSYRSAIVMLYSVTIADLMFKLQELVDVYEDSAANKILGAIKTKQEKNPRNPDWEYCLIEQVGEKTCLLEAADKLHIESLHNLRHLCAHPILTQNFELYKPNMETVRATIINILEGVLTKPALLSRKIFDDFSNDLASEKSLFSDDELKTYLNDKYFNRFGEKTMDHIFSSLWKIIFKTNDKKCCENRKINLKALIIVFERKSEHFLSLIKKEKDIFSNISLEHNTFFTFISLLNQFPQIFDNLNEGKKIEIESKIKQNPHAEAFAIFLTKDINRHIEKVLSINEKTTGCISNSSINEIFQQARCVCANDLAFNFLIKMYGKSFSYDMADDRFDRLINPWINSFDKNQFCTLLKETNNNRQIYNRMRASFANSLIKKRIDELWPDFNFEEYSNFKVHDT